MPRQPEGKLVAKIKALLATNGARPFKIQGSDESFQEVGIPDLLVCVVGRFVGMEVKQPGEPLRAAQRVELCEIYKAGGVAAVVESVEQVRKLLSSIERRSSHSGPVCYDRGIFRGEC